jgi:hypothetical protein
VRPSPPRLSTLLLSLLLPLLWPQSAMAYEDQLTLSVGPGYAAAIGGEPVHGALLDFGAGMGLDEVWTIRARASYALHPAEAPAQVGLMAGELLYVVDILEVVPYFGVGAGGMVTLREGEGELAGIAYPVLGAQYLLTRELSLGLDVRPVIRFTDLGEQPVYLAARLALVFVFDLY